MPDIDDAFASFTMAVSPGSRNEVVVAPSVVVVEGDERARRVLSAFSSRSMMRFALRKPPVCARTSYPFGIGAGEAKRSVPGVSAIVAHERDPGDATNQEASDADAGET